MEGCEEFTLQLSIMIYCNSIYIYQQALDETLKEKQKMQSCFNQEYEKLRTLNSEREQQLLNDFEWKLREVEMNCKRRIEEKKTNNEEKIQIMRKQFEQEIVQLKEQLKEVSKIYGNIFFIDRSKLASTLPVW